MTVFSHSFGKKSRLLVGQYRRHDDVLRDRAQQVKGARRDRARRCPPQRPISSCSSTRHATPTTAGRTLRVDDLFWVVCVCVHSGFKM